ncbi:MAG: AAA family ATPase, partial [Acidobacteriota bacterium]|nr:AAA family ATPase [Acidobacteriota bacterium]
MRIVSVSFRNFRTYEAAAAPLGGGLTVVWGPNGAGKTNLLEGVYFGCTGRSCRTANDRELVRFGERTTRVEVVATD